MGHAGNVADDAVGRLGGDERAVAVAPIGQSFQKIGIGLLVVLDHFELGHPRPCVGKGEAGP